LHTCSTCAANSCSSALAVRRIDALADGVRVGGAVAAEIAVLEIDARDPSGSGVNQFSTSLDFARSGSYCHFR
jgi:hypothetical protein